ncbi:sensor domain-containing diguanylate cyclase [Mycolicibacterium sp. CH28]|uniref:diguanylate cyclase domain-containing protein n=1 Tax=Mycolicibacterium sp. CH28 TaxID=2512237 RepID=UPI00108007F6|nr:diguanylate cyclase [Mycolicibacterium sp. CH28]TGD88314.1 sensor domain-containing diguanylate cyclase [Mycolicibacterium sp. CH28]
MAPDDPVCLDEELSRLRRLIDRLPAMIGYWDNQLHNVIANDAHRDYFGKTPAEIRGRHIRELLGEAVYASNLPHIRGALAGREQRFEREFVDCEGATRYILACYVPDVVDGTVQGFFVQVTEVTARVEAERARDEALRLLQVSMANAPFGKAVLTTSGRALMVNPALCQLVGLTADELMGASCRDLVHPDDLDAAIEEHRQLLSGEAAQISSERRYIRRDGSTIWLQCSAVLAPGREYGAEGVVVEQFQDVTARKLAEAELARLAETDQLTGLHNRHALIGRIEQHRAAEPTQNLGVVFVDLDGFKQVNDIRGHAAGDSVLVEVARRLRQQVPEPNSVYRLGGDEFVVLVPAVGDAAAVADLAAAISSASTGRYDVGADRCHLTASVGWTWGPAGDAEELIRRADTDMYRHKAEHRESFKSLWQVVAAQRAQP